MEESKLTDGKMFTDADLGLSSKSSVNKTYTDADLGLGSSAKPSVGQDIKQTLLPAAGRAAAGFLSLPAFLDDAGGYIYRKGQNLVAPLTGHEALTYDKHMAERKAEEQQGVLRGDVPFPREFSYDYFKSKIEPITGDYQPQTRAGKLVGTGVELLPNLIGNKARLAESLVKDVAVPALAGTAAEAALEGTAYEPYAKIAGIISGQMGAHTAHSMAKGTNSSLITPVIGKEKDVKLPSGEALLNEFGVPVRATERQQRLAATEFQKAAGLDKPATIDSPIIKTIDENLKDNVEGFKPTTYQATGNKGLGGLESSFAARKAGEYNELLDQQNNARVTALRNLQKDGTPESLVDYFRKNFDLEETKRQFQLEDALAQAQNAGEKVANGRSAGDIGAGLRDSFDIANKQNKELIKNLYNALGDSREITFSTIPMKNNLKTFAEGLPKSFEGFSDTERKLHESIGKLKDVDTLEEISEIRSRISEAMRKEKNVNFGDETKEFARLNKLREYIQDVVDNGLKHKAAMEQELVAKGLLKPEDSMIQRLQTATKEQLPDNTVYAGNKPIDVKYDIVEHKDLVTSHDKNFNLNKNYPQELQPRDRSSAASQVQVESFAKNFDPERYGVTKDANAGAPIINADNIVESGNGRTLALGKAYEQGKGEQYKEFLRSQGHNIDGFEQPVLVARRTTDMPKDQVQEYAQSLASQSGLRMTPAEMAVRDAGRLSDEVFTSLAGSGELTANKAFAKQFFKDMPVEEQATYVDRSGNLTQSGLARIEAGVLQKAYGDSNLTRRAVEALDPAGKNMISGLADAAPEWAAMRSAVKSGDIPKDMDITPEIQKLMNASFSAKDKGLKYGAFLNQADLEHGLINKGVADLFFDDKGSILSKRAISENLHNYALEAQKVKVNDMFGAPSVDKVLESTKKNRSDVAGVEELSTKNNAPIVDIKAEKQPVLPNLDETIAPKLAEATSAYKKRQEIYSNSDIAKIFNSKRNSDSALLGKIFVSGDRGGEVASKYLKTTNNTPESLSALKDAAMYSLERSGVIKDGVVDPKVLDRWTRSHKEVLSVMPKDFVESLNDAKTATMTYNDLASSYAKQTADYNKSALGKILNTNNKTEIADAVGDLFSKNTPISDATRLIEKAATDKNAMEGLRKSVSDYITNKFITLQEQGVTGERKLNNSGFREFLNNQKNVELLDKLFSKDQIDGLRKIGESIEKTNRSLSAKNMADRFVSEQNLSPLVSKAAQKGQMGVINSAVAGQVTFGPLGAALGALTAGVGKLVPPLYAKGITNVEELMWAAVKDPDFAKVLAMAKPYAPNSPVERTLLNQVGKLSVYNQIQEEHKQRKERKYGGRVDLNRAVELAKREVTRDSLPILQTPDEDVHQALRLARGG